MLIKIYFDGLCQPVNPRGVAVSAYVILSGSRVIKTGVGLATKPYSDAATNNVAEYMGLICGLKEGLLYSRRAEVFGDSRLVVKQINGEFKVKDSKLLRLNAKAKEIMKGYDQVSVSWVPREENADADRLTKHGYRIFLERGNLKPVCDIAMELAEEP